MSVNAETGVAGMVTVSPDVTIRQGNGVNYSFSERAVISKLEINSASIEINDNFLIGATTSSGYLSNELIDYDPSSNIRWIGTCTVETATVTYIVSGLSSSAYYDIFVDGLRTKSLSSDLAGGISYTYLGTWSTHEFIIQRGEIPGSGVMASFEYRVSHSTVYFTDKSYNGAVVWVWNFGDGFGSTSQSPTHEYKMSGVYHVSLTVFDEDAKSSRAETTIEVILGPDNPVERTDDGWNVYLMDGYIVSLGAIGLMFAGAVMFLTGMFIKSLPILTSKGRMAIGVILMLAGAYYLIFVNNSWLG